jgi:serine/threonine protein kinase
MLAPGALVDRYRLVAALGEGGQGSVWKAIDQLPPHPERALKLMSLRGMSPDLLARARREAHTLAQLQHPSLVRCFGLFESYELAILGLALELVHGPTAEQALRDPRFTPHHRMALLKQVAGALAYLHDQGIVHRDLKEANIVLAPEFWDYPDSPGTIKLIDLGIASAIGNAEGLTGEGRFIGTLPYVAPETLAPRRFPGPAHTPAADVFAFGVIASQLLLGRHPAGPLPANPDVVDLVQAYESIDSHPLAPSSYAWTRLIDACSAPSPRRRLPDGAAILRYLQEGASAPASRDSSTALATGPEPAPGAPSQAPHSTPFPPASLRPYSTPFPPEARPSATSLIPPFPGPPPSSTVPWSPDSRSARTEKGIALSGERLSTEIMAPPGSRGRGLPWWLAGAVLAGSGALLLGIAAMVGLISSNPQEWFETPSHPVVPTPTTPTSTVTTPPPRPEVWTCKPKECGTEWAETTGPEKSPITPAMYPFQLSFVNVDNTTGSGRPHGSLYEYYPQAQVCISTGGPEQCISHTRCRGDSFPLVDPSDLRAGNLTFRVQVPTSSGPVTIAEGRFPRLDMFNTGLCTGYITTTVRMMDTSLGFKITKIGFFLGKPP